MYPGTQFNWIDQSQILTEEDITVLDNSPLFMVVGSFDKGPEDLMEVSGSQFNQLFGSMNFEKHGQNSIQAQRIINAGARILIKRVCAEDSKLANLVLLAKVTESEVPVDQDTVKIATIKWEAQQVQNATSFEDVLDTAKGMYDAANNVYPIIAITDNGRGTSSKAFRLVPDYNTSKSIGSMFYTAVVYEGVALTDNEPVTVDPSVVYSNKSYGLDRSVMTQVKAETIPEMFNEFVSKVADIIGYDAKTVSTFDLINGYDYKGRAVTDQRLKTAGSDPRIVKVDPDSVNINADYGIELKEGSNGAFGNYPVKTTEWVKAISDVYSGKDPQVGDMVWDVDQYKIAAICDANFPFEVKNAISEFVSFRKDCMYFRDLGLDLDSFIKIKTAKEKNIINNNFIADYFTSYMVKDPTTQKNIKVTMMYDFVECLANHFSNGVSNPTAGLANKFILSEAIKGTVCYTPIVTPTANQKEAIDELRVNYAIFQDDDCVVQSLYTSQEEYTELSFICNTLAIQEVARAVRTACPKNRFTRASGYDFSSYKKAVNLVLSDFIGNFSILDFVYTKNKLQSSQKLFYGSIRFAFNQWAQTELFDLIAINNED